MLLRWRKSLCCVHLSTHVGWNSHARDGFPECNSAGCVSPVVGKAHCLVREDYVTSVRCAQQWLQFYPNPCDFSRSRKDSLVHWSPTGLLKVSALLKKWRVQLVRYVCDS